jgi:hypothetical protein
MRIGNRQSRVIFHHERMFAFLIRPPQPNARSRRNISRCLTGLGMGGLPAIIAI